MEKTSTRLSTRISRFLQWRPMFFLFFVVVFFRFYSVLRHSRVKGRRAAAAAAETEGTDEYS